MNLGPMELGLLLLVMVMVFGPRRITEIGKSMGEALAGFRKAAREEDPPAAKLAARQENSEAQA